jgi:hypothetical protein
MPANVFQPLKQALLNPKLSSRVQGFGLQRPPARPESGEFAAMAAYQGEGRGWWWFSRLYSTAERVSYSAGEHGRRLARRANLVHVVVEIAVDAYRTASIYYDEPPVRELVVMG